MQDHLVERTARRECVLVVEDDESINEMLQIVLDMEGYDVVAAGSGREAMAWLTETPGSPVTEHNGCWPIDLILLDLQMPEMTGEDLVTQLTERGYTLPPIVVLSARREQSVETSACAIGATEFLLKPFEINDLLASVQRALRPIA